MLGQRVFFDFRQGHDLYKICIQSIRQIQQHSPTHPPLVSLIHRSINGALHAIRSYAPWGGMFEFVLRFARRLLDPLRLRREELSTGVLLMLSRLVLARLGLLFSIGVQLVFFSSKSNHCRRKSAMLSQAFTCAMWCCTCSFSLLSYNKQQSCAPTATILCFFFLTKSGGRARSNSF